MLWNWIVANGDTVTADLTGIGALVTATGTAQSLGLSPHVVAIVTVICAALSVIHGHAISSTKQVEAKAALKAAP